MTTSHPIRFVSLGPGEPDLITLKGFKALQTADCIFCPATMSPRREIFVTGTFHLGHSRILGHRTMFSASNGQRSDTSSKMPTKLYTKAAKHSVRKEKTL